MSNHRGPEGCAPDDQRCDALVRGSGTTSYYEWTRHDRRCSKHAKQGRAGIAVCHIHAGTKEVTPWKSSSGEV